MAQLGARLNGIQEVGGSIPPSSTKKIEAPGSARRVGKIERRRNNTPALFIFPICDYVGATA